MSFKKKITLIVIVSTLLIASIGSLGILSLTKYERTAQKLNAAVNEVRSVYNLQHDFQMISIKFDELYESRDTSRVSSIADELALLNEEINKSKDEIACSECKKTFNAIVFELSKLTPLLSNIQTAFSADDYEVARAEKTKVNEIITTTSQLLAMSVEMTASLAGELERESHDEFIRYRTLLAIASLLFILFFSAVSYSLTRGIMRSIKELNNATQEFADGNRKRRVDSHMPHDFLLLAESFNQMATAIESSEESMATMNRLLSKEVGQQRNRLKTAHQQTKQRMQEIAAYLGLAKSLTSSLSMDDILNKSIAALSDVFDVDYIVFGLIAENSLSHCWEVEGCDTKACPAYKSTNLECWTLNRTFCRNRVQGEFVDKIEECVNCNVFRNTNIKIHATYGGNLNSTIGIEVPLHSSVCGQSLLRLSPWGVENLADLTGYCSLRNMEPDCASQISIPLITNNRVLGTMVFGYKNKRSFNESDIDLISGLCRQIAVSIDNARLFSQTTKSARDFNMLYRAGEKISSLLEEQDIAHTLLDFALDIAQVDSGAVYLNIDDSGLLKRAAHKKMSKDISDVLYKKTGDSLIGNVVKHREPLLIDERYAKNKWGLKQIHSAIISPIQYNGEVYGAIALTSDSEQIFGISDLQTLSTIAGLASTALHNAKLLKELEQLYIDTVKAFVQAIEAKDSYTRGHSENVALYAAAIAKKMELGAARIKFIETAALLHDIGKIGVREDILNKPGRLTAEEYEYIKLHPQISYQILEHVPSLKALAEVILYHHEKFDGTGYAKGLSNIDIPLEARILAVADAFDAMTSERPYRKPATLQEARTELVENSGAQFDPAIVRVFLELIDERDIEFPFEDSDEPDNDDIAEVGA